MRFILSTEIPMPMTEICRIVVNTNCQAKCMKGYISSVVLSGEKGETKAQMKLKIKLGPTSIKVRETIINNSLPDELICCYQTRGIQYTIKNIFTEITENTTDFFSVHEFSFHSFWKIISFFASNYFKSYSYYYVAKFKDYIIMYNMLNTSLKYCHKTYT